MNGSVKSEQKRKVWTVGIVLYIPVHSTCHGLFYRVATYQYSYKDTAQYYFNCFHHSINDRCILPYLPVTRRDHNPCADDECLISGRLQPT